MSTALIIFGFLACTAAALFGIYLLAFRPGQRRRGFFIASWAFLIFVAVTFSAMYLDAREDGWAGMRDKTAAQAAGITTPGAWAAAQQADAVATAEQAALQAADEKRKGFHCLSAWDGSHDGVVAAAKQVLRDPDSFEHIRTLITTVKPDGTHRLTMEYRARNGFGGMNVATAAAEIDNETCNATLLSIE